MLLAKSTLAHHKEIGKRDLQSSSCLQVLLLGLSHQRHLERIDAQAVNVLLIIISTVASYCVWWLRSFILFALMSGVNSVCSYIDYKGVKICARYADDEKKLKEEIERKRAQRAWEEKQKGKRATQVLEFRNGRTFQTQIKGRDFELKQRVA